MKIYFASQSFYPHIGGVSTYLLNLARELQKRGNEVTEVHLRPSGEPNEEEVKGIEIHRVPKEPLDKEMLKGYTRFKEAIYKGCHNYNVFNKSAHKMEGYEDFNQINTCFGEEVRNLLENTPAEVVHIHDFQLIYLYKFIPRGTPLVFTWHIPFTDSIPKPLADYLIKYMNEYDKVVFSSQDYIDAALKAGLEKDKPELIYPIANTKLFRRMEINKNTVKKRYKIPTNAKVILCVQRIDPKSGHEQLLKAMPTILKRIPEAKLVFVGSQSMSNKLSKDREVYQKRVIKLIKDLNLSEHIIFTGNIDYLKLPKLYNATDIVALTSRTEGFGLSVTEGMACGKPIIGTKAGGIPIQVKNNINGYLVEVGDYKSTANRIIHLLKDDKLREKMGKKSLEMVQNNFAMQIPVEKHLILYNKIIKKKHEMRRLEFMRLEDVRALITDYDRTITDESGKLKRKTLDLIGSLKTNLVLVTGRSFSYVKQLCRKFRGWSCIVAENGAIVYFPRTKTKLTITSEYMVDVRKIIKKSGIKHTMGDVIISIPIKYSKKVRNLLKKYNRFIRGW